MAQLRHGYEEFVDNGAEVIVIGPDSSQAFANYFAEHNLPFIGLPNPDHSVLKTFGQEVNIFKLGRMPAQVVIDRQGIVRYVHYGKNMADIPDNEELLAILAHLNEALIYD